MSLWLFDILQKGIEQLVCSLLGRLIYVVFEHFTGGSQPARGEHWGLPGFDSSFFVHGPDGLPQLFKSRPCQGRELFREVRSFMRQIHVLEKFLCPRGIGETKFSLNLMEPSFKITLNAFASDAVQMLTHFKNLVV